MYDETFLESRLAGAISQLQSALDFIKVGDFREARLATTMAETYLVHAMLEERTIMHTDINNLNTIKTDVAKRAFDLAKQCEVSNE